MLYPLGERVLVRRLEAEDMSPGGIYIPPNAKERPVRGVVVAVGPIAPEGYEDVAEEDVVLFGKFAGTEVQGQDDLVILRFEELLAIDSGEDA